MANKNKKELEEKFESSYGVNASVPDPVGAGDAHANRHADNLANKDDEPTSYPKTQMIADILGKIYSASETDLPGMYRQFMNMGGGTGQHDKNLSSITPKNKPVAEDLDTVFQGLELSEETRSRALTIFEAAVTAKMIEEKAQLDEEFEERLESAIREAVETLEEKTDTYLSYVADRWLEENALQVESGLRADIAESFIEGLRRLFEEHYIDMPADKVDVVAEMASEVERLEDELNEAHQLLAQRVAAEKDARRKEIVAEMSGDMSATQADKLRKLAEAVEFDTEENFRENLKVVAESFVKKQPFVRAAEESLNEEVMIDSPSQPAQSGDLVVDNIAAFVGKRFGARQ